MKKLYFAMLALCLSFISSSAADLYLRGMDGWDVKDAWKFTTTDNENYTLAGVNLTANTEFKIADQGYSQGYNFGEQKDMVANQDYTLKENGGNMTVASNINNATIKFNRITKVLRIETAPQEEVITYAIHGQITGNSKWESTDLTEADGVWSLTRDFVAGNFGVKKMTNGSQTGWYGWSALVTPNDNCSAADGGNISLTKDGNYTISFNPATEKISVKENVAAQKLYVRGGNVNGTSNDEWPIQELTLSDGLYSFTAKGEFSLSTSNQDWDSGWKTNALQLDGAWTEADGKKSAKLKGGYNNIKLDDQEHTFYVTEDLKTIYITTAVTPPVVDYSNWYVNVRGDFNNNQDNGVQPFNGISKHEGLAIGAGEFEVKIWDGSKDTYYGDQSNAIVCGDWQQIYVNGGKMKISGAADGDMFDVEFDCATNKIKVTKVGGVTPPVEDEGFNVYFDNSKSQWAEPILIHYWGGKTATTWENCPSCEKVRDNLYTYKVPAGTTGVIFRGSDKQTADIKDGALKPGHIYQANSGGSNTACTDLGEYVAPVITYQMYGSLVVGNEAQVIELTQNAAGLWEIKNVACEGTQDNPARFQVQKLVNGEVTEYYYYASSQAPANIADNYNLVWLSTRGLYPAHSGNEMCYSILNGNYSFQVNPENNSLKVIGGPRISNMEDGHMVVYFDTQSADCDHARTWNPVYCYAWNINMGSEENHEFPGVEMTKVEGEEGLWMVVLDKEYDGIIFSEGKDKPKTADIPDPAHNFVYDHCGNCHDHGNFTHDDDITVTPATLLAHTETININDDNTISGHKIIGTDFEQYYFYVKFDVAENHRVTVRYSKGDVADPASCAPRRAEGEEPTTVSDDLPDRNHLETEAHTFTFYPEQNGTDEGIVGVPVGQGNLILTTEYVKPDGTPINPTTQTYAYDVKTVVDTTGIEGVEVDGATEAVYYNLQGVRVEQPTAGTYIRVVGTTAVKVRF